MPPNASPEPSPLDQPAGSAASDAPAPRVTHVEDTAEADVADNAANEVTDALIDAAEADPVVPGEPKDAHQ